ncbi:hypothetical protein [Ferruginibacter sp. SUN106]|uniref:hypothetical protein n=1 Tax=Ferruginibacter sp. SUN106 TaxID=2978348 RepID=UPI003D36B2EC
MALKRLLLLLMVVLISPVVFSQNNINGVWEGKFLAANTDLGEPRLVVEIYNLKDSVFTGITHLYYEGNKYEHYKMVGSYNKKNGVLMFLEASTIAVDLGIYSNCLGTYTTVLRKDGDKMFQFGYWVSTIKNCSPTTNVWLQKREEIINKIPEENKKTEVVKKTAVTDKPVAKPLKEKTGTPAIAIPSEVPVVKTAPPIKTAPVVMPAKIAQRETDVQSLLEIAPADKDSIKVDVYDNGEIDGDSVSVYEEHMVRVNKKMITAKPITFYISLDKNVNPIAHLRLVAESLGSIPPCTALMVITTKSKRYEVRLSSNFSKNATVEFFLKE